MHPHDPLNSSSDQKFGHDLGRLDWEFYELKERAEKVLQTKESYHSKWYASVKPNRLKALIGKW